MDKIDPKVTCFVESREEAELSVNKGEVKSRGEYLLNRIGQDPVTDLLADVNGRISIALNEQEIGNDAALMELLREFNLKGIPLDIWVNLSDEDGYWIHAGNICETGRTTWAMLESLERLNVKADGVGLDLEFPGQMMIPKWNFEEYKRIAPWRFSQKKATESVQRMSEGLLGQGYGVKTYEIPILGDNRAVRKGMGIPKAPIIDNPNYERVGMVYTSVKPPLICDETFINRWSQVKGRTPALGIVTADPALNPGRGQNFTQFLDNERLKRNIKTALEANPEGFHIFALNGLPMIQRVKDAIILAKLGY
jgi:hypothetical protein